MIIYTVFKLRDINSIMYGQMLSLNLGAGGHALSHMKKARADNCDYTYVCLAATEENELIGWAMLVGQFEDNKFDRYGLNLFVKPSCRKMDIGTNLFKLANETLNKIDRHAYVAIWSEESEYFYNKNKSDRIEVVVSLAYTPKGK